MELPTSSTGRATLEVTPDADSCSLLPSCSPLAPLEVLGTPLTQSGAFQHHSGERQLQASPADRELLDFLPQLQPHSQSASALPGMRLSSITARAASVPLVETSKAASECVLPCALTPISRGEANPCYCLLRRKQPYNRGSP